MISGLSQIGAARFFVADGNQYELIHMTVQYGHMKKIMRPGAGSRSLKFDMKKLWIAN